MILHMRRIACVTGTRADYGYLRPVMREIKKDEKLKLIVVATGMHFFEKFGHTIDEVKKDFPNVKEVPLILPKNTGLGTAKYVAEGIEKLSKVFKNLQPDFCLFLGDRTETFAGVQAAAYQNIPIAHMHGGDKTCTLDEPIRHSITKFAHIHFPATEKSAERIKKMGEEPWRIYTVGSSTHDEILNIGLPKKEKLLSKYSLDSNKAFIIVAQHSIPLEIDKSEEQIRATLNAVLKTNLQALVIYPNVDQGGQKIIDIIKKYERKSLRVVASLPREDYLGLLKYAYCLVGNSSSGIIEASSFKTPAINIGNRQYGRERATNVIDVSYFEEEKILDAINYSLQNNQFREKLKNCKNPYGDGKTGRRICEILSGIEINNKLLQKKITY